MRNCIIQTTNKFLFCRFGWDCHGLPVEYEIDKTLNIKGPEDVAKMGIEAYNNECRKIVTRYSKEWEQIVGRMGRWIGKNFIVYFKMKHVMIKNCFQISKMITKQCTCGSWKASGGCSSNST